jgi:hypothetical protein
LPAAFGAATDFAALAARGDDAFFPAVFFSAILAACFFAIEFDLLTSSRRPWFLASGQTRTGVI